MVLFLTACQEQPAPRAAIVIDSPATVAPVTPDTLVGIAAPAVDSVPFPAVVTAVGAADSSDTSTLAAQIMVPVQGVAVSQLRDNYTEPRAGHSHEAMDILAPRGTPVLAAVDGKLTKLHNSVAGGLMVYAGDAYDRFVFMYGHLDRYADGVTEGMSLKRGQVIGYVGTTGNAPPGTPHLHFAVARGKPSAAWWKGAPINPYLLFTQPSGTIATRTDPAVAPVPIVVPPAEPAVKVSDAKRIIEPRARLAITAIAAHDMNALAKLVHPTKGVRFSPYMHVDPATDHRYTRDQLRPAWPSKSIVVWGTHDGSGAPIRLTFAEYYKSFIYDYGFVKAPKIGYDEEFMGRGNTINNIRANYPGAMVVEYHAPGIDPRYGGMDWKSLVLVFEKSGSEWFLVGVVHGSWTI